jgi:hypothetical protein
MADQRSGYRDDLDGGLTAALGDARSGETAGRQWLEGRTLPAAGQVIVSEAETSLSGEAGWLAALQPPSAADDELRSQALDAMAACSTRVEQLRIAINRGDAAQARRALEELRVANTALEDLAEGLS